MVRVVDGEDGEQLVVPRGAVELLARVLAHMANGHSVSWRNPPEASMTCCTGLNGLA